MKIPWILRISFPLALMGCSILGRRINYVTQKTELTQPVCTIWNSVDGAALISVFDAQVLVKPPGLNQTLFAGPPLIPFVPILNYSDSFNAHIEIQILPTDSEPLLLTPSEIELRFDGRPIRFEMADYRFKGETNREVTTGLLEKEDLKKTVRINRPYSLNMIGRVEPLPEQMEVSFSLKNGSAEIRKTLSFRRVDRTNYIALFIPATEMDEGCKTVIPGRGAARDLF